MMLEEIELKGVSDSKIGLEIAISLELIPANSVAGRAIGKMAREIARRMVMQAFVSARRNPEDLFDPEKHKETVDFIQSIPGFYFGGEIPIDFLINPRSLTAKGVEAVAESIYERKPELFTVVELDEETKKAAAIFILQERSTRNIDLWGWDVGSIGAFLLKSNSVGVRLNSDGRLNRGAEISKKAIVGSVQFRELPEDERVRIYADVIAFAILELEERWLEQRDRTFLGYDLARWKSKRENILDIVASRVVEVDSKIRKERFDEEISNRIRMKEVNGEMRWIEV